MTWIDVFPIVLLLVYGVGGYFTGLVRRFIGLVALFIAFWAATNMGLQAGGILQQTSNFDVPTSRIYGFFGIIFAILVIVEVATQIAHKQIQIQAIVLNRGFGVALGLLTAFLLSVVTIYALDKAANPVGTTALDPVELGLQSALGHSLFMAKLVKAIDTPIIYIFQPLLPTDPQVYFSNGLVS